MSHEPIIGEPHKPPEPAEQIARTDAHSILNIRNIITVGLMVVAFYLMFLIRGVFALFIAAMTIAFLLYPAVQFVHRSSLLGRKLSIGLSILLVFIVGTALVTVASIVAVDQVGQQVRQLTDAILATDWTGIMAQARSWASQNEELLRRVGLAPETVEARLQELITQIDIEQVVGRFVSNVREFKWGALFGGIGTVIGVLVALPIIVFYMIKDAHQIRATLMGFVPPAVIPDTERFLRNLEHTLNSYLRGQLKLGLAIFLLDAVALKLFTPLESWFLLAVVAGITEIIPVVGPTIAMVFGLLMAVVEIGTAPPAVVDAAGQVIAAGGPDPSVLITVFIIFIVVQTIENQILVPRIMGKQLDVHPLTVMFFLLAGGVLGGVVGALLSLPVAATLKVLVSQYYPTFIRRVEALFLDTPDPPPPVLITTP